MMLSTSFSNLRGKAPALRVLCFALSLLTLAMLAFPGGAFAQTAPAGNPGSAANVEIDANYFSGVTFTGASFLSGNDWSQGATGSALLLQSGGRSVLGLNNATNSLWFRDPNWGTGNDPTQYKGGQKNDQAIDAASTHWAVTDTTAGGGSPQKNDITNCYISTQVDGATGHRWVVAGFETRATNGVSFAGLELDQKGMFVDRTSPGNNKITGRATGTGAIGGRVAGTVDILGHLVGGDILLIVDYTNGGTKPIVSVREWSTNSGGSWTLIADSLTAGKGFVTTNTANIPAVAPGQGVSPQGNLTDTTVALQFVEFGLDLTGLNLLPLDPCNPLATALFQTRSSASFTSSLMDFALGRFAVIPPPAADAGPDQAVCSAGDVNSFTLAGSATNGTPLWSVLSGRVAIADPSSLTSSITDTGTGTALLVLTVTSTQGCGVVSDTVAITVNPNPTVSVNSPEVCASTLPSTLTATPAGGTGSKTFAWSTGATTSTISTSTAGTYSVTVTDTKGCTGSGTGTLTVNPNPTVSVPNAEVCASAVPGTLTATPSGGTGSKTFAWSTGATTSTISSSTTATFSVTVTDTKGCTGSGSGTLTVNPNPTVSVNNPSSCSGTAATLTATPAGGTGSKTFAWSSGETTSTISTSTAGTYSVTVTDTKGCTGSGTGTLSTNPNLTVGVNSPEVCASTLPATLTATPSSGTPNFTYSWSTGATTSTIGASTAGTYSVTVTDSKGCTGSSTGTLTVNPNPTVTVNSPEVCASTLPATLTATPAGGTGAAGFAWSTGATTSTISTSTGGTYSVTVTDTKGCTGSGSGTLTVDPNPTVSVNSPSVCGGVAATLTATPASGTGAKTFAWSSGETTSTISTSTAGTYSVTVTDTKGCTGSGSGTVSVTPNPTVSVNSPEACSGTSATLTATPAGGTGSKTFAWSTGATTSTISTSTAGTYSVTVTDTKGCTGSGTGTLTVDPNPTVSVANDSVCPGTAATLTASASSGTPGYSYSWSTGATTSTISTSTAGTYSVTVTDTKGCTGSGTGRLVNYTPPTVSATGGTITCIQHCVQISASPSGMTYSWTGPGGYTSAAQSPTVCDSGTYLVTVTDTHGCSGTASAHVRNVIPTIPPCSPTDTVKKGFELDGNAFAVSPNPPDDWNLFLPGGINGSTVSTGIVNDFPSNNDDYFVIGTKDLTDVTSWRYNIQSTPDKDDILHGGAAQYGGKLYFFGDRYDVSGDAQIGFWFLKDTVNVVVPGSTFSGKHQVGDLLVLSNFIKGGGVPQILAFEWVGSGGSDGQLDSLPVASIHRFAIVNTTPQPSPWPFQAKGRVAANTFPAGAFFEGGIDLACLVGINPCFSNFILETRSSQSVTASLKDFLIGHFSPSDGAISIPLNPAGLEENSAGSGKSATIPSGYSLHANYPNPFNPTTQIKFDLPEASTVRLSVFNILGQEVATLVNGTMAAGYQSVEWNSANRAGASLPSGVYMYRLQATSITSGKEFHDVMKMVLMK